VKRKLLSKSKTKDAWSLEKDASAEIDSWLGLTQLHKISL